MPGSIFHLPVFLVPAPLLCLLRHSYPSCPRHSLALPLPLAAFLQGRSAPVRTLACATLAAPSLPPTCERADSRRVRSQAFAPPPNQKYGKSEHGLVHWALKASSSRSMANPRARERTGRHPIHFGTCESNELKAAQTAGPARLHIPSGERRPPKTIIGAACRDGSSSNPHVDNANTGRQA